MNTKLKMMVALSCLMLWGSEIFAQRDRVQPGDNEPAATETETGEGKADKVPIKRKKRRGYREQSYLLLHYGLANTVVGYQNPLYIGSDKSDQISSLNSTYGLEYRGVLGGAADDVNDSLDSDFEQITLGFLMAGTHNHFTRQQVIEKDPPWVKEKVSAKIKTDFRMMVGFFFGFGNSSVFLEPGVGVVLPFEDEEFRRKRRESNKDEIVKVKGRGLLLQNPTLIPNAKLRLGNENGVHVKFMALREQYSYFHDAVQFAIHMPMGKMFALEAGSGFYPVATFFLKPVIKTDFIELHLKLSGVISFYDDNLEKIVAEDMWMVNFGAKMVF